MDTAMKRDVCITPTENGGSAAMTVKAELSRYACGLTPERQGIRT